MLELQFDKYQRKAISYQGEICKNGIIITIIFAIDTGTYETVIRQDILEKILHASPLGEKKITSASGREIAYNIKLDYLIFKNIKQKNPVILAKNLPKTLTVEGLLGR